MAGHEVSWGEENLYLLPHRLRGGFIKNVIDLPKRREYKYDRK
jgi:hypothetical protein